MKRSTLKLIAAILVATFALTACAAMTGQDPRVKGACADGYCPVMPQ